MEIPRILYEFSGYNYKKGGEERRGEERRGKGRKNAVKPQQTSMEIENSTDANETALV